MMDRQERGRCGGIFAVGWLKIVQLVCTEMAFPACSNHFLKDLLKESQARQGPVVLQRLFNHIRLLYQWTNVCLFETCWNIRMNQWLAYDCGDEMGRHSSTLFSRFVGSGSSSQDFDGEFIMTACTWSWVAGLKCVKCWPSNLTSALIMVSLMGEPLLITVSLILGVFFVKKSLNLFAKSLSNEHLGRMISPLCLVRFLVILKRPSCCTHILLSYWQK